METIPELTEEEAIDNDYDKMEGEGGDGDKDSLFSNDEDAKKEDKINVGAKAELEKMSEKLDHHHTHHHHHHKHLHPTAGAGKDKLDSSLMSTQLSDAFSMVFDPTENMYNFWSTYRFLQHSPRKILYDIKQEGKDLTVPNS